MPYFYDNRAGYSEATKMLGSMGNLATKNIGVFSLWFHGNPANDAEPMYVGASDGTGRSAVLYHHDPDAARIGEWTQWRIDLQQLAAQAVNPANIESIAIGFGAKGGVILPGGSGKVYFDDIRLCPAQMSQ